MVIFLTCFEMLQCFNQKRVGSKRFWVDMNSSPKNNQYDDQLSREGRHAYTHWKGIFEHYTMKK